MNHLEEIITWCQGKMISLEEKSDKPLLMPIYGALLDIQRLISNGLASEPGSAPAQDEIDIKTITRYGAAGIELISNKRYSLNGLPPKKEIKPKRRRRKAVKEPALMNVMH
ncbi:hypothetical protein Halhy_4047 [Haliscomenobacter hydrossis DSM 1100]|uniref:Uncharacterized protein n=1 Tax=Haliscomenobacter hydrossis (strain ATCC 27775 / DSM 1100 / LMG 10767 / O) TaxID=760192 RepID=F4L5R0_HALH1|nr:hypothetical protein Halhy_4047 [Haliscomenobacter hydrossis DSM 1100]